MIQYKHKPTGKIFIKMTRFGIPFYLSENDYLKWKNSMFNELVEIYVFSNGDKIPSDIVESGKDWELVKEVLFRTEDGVDVYEGDKIHRVGKDFEISTFTLCSSATNKQYKYFKHIVHAEQYIAETQPKYSLQDIKNALRNCEEFYLKDSRKIKNDIVNYLING